MKARVAQIEAEIKTATSSYDKEKLEERKAKLQGGVAVIKVGAPTESEMKKKKQMFEDSLNSTRAALEEGIVPGGGVALLRACRSPGNLKLEKEEQAGANILLRACEAPFRQIVLNTGYDPRSYSMKCSKEGKQFRIQRHHRKSRGLAQERRHRSSESRETTACRTQSRWPASSSSPKR